MVDHGPDAHVPTSGVPADRSQGLPRHAAPASPIQRPGTFSAPPEAVARWAGIVRARRAKALVPRQVGAELHW